MRGSWGPIKHLPFGLVLKLGKLGAAEEAKTIQFIRKNTRIPVPCVVLSATGIWNNYMLMKRIDGELLHSTWEHLSKEQRSHVVEQLRSFVEQLRSLSTPQPPVVSALHNAPCLDARVAGSRTFGPFTTVAAFNDHLIDVSRIYMDEHDLQNIRSQMSDHHRIFFTHGDLAPRNIFVKGDKVVALIDWEHAGWYPEYERDLQLDKQLSDRMVGAI
jgi:aminoglycoside phosphotransferase (APT) family kinase protein